MRSGRIYLSGEEEGRKITRWLLSGGEIQYNRRRMTKEGLMTDKFLMLGKYSPDSMKEMTAARTKKALALIEKAGGKVNAMYALLGNYDLAFIIDFPGQKEAMRASLELTKLTGIGFTTSPAITIEEFDRIIS